jgi:hypothetical protein
MTGGGGLGAGGKGALDRAKIWQDVQRQSQAGSVHNLFGVPELVGSNFFGDLAGAFLGPEPGTDPTTETNARIDQGLHASTELPIHVGAELALEAETGWDLVNIADTGLLTFTPETIGSLTVAGDITVGALTQSILWGKIGLDALVYAESLAVCSLR